MQCNLVEVHGSSVDYIQGNQKELIRHINSRRLHIELLEEGFSKLVKEQEAFMDNVHEEVDRIYDVIERMKCAAVQTQAQLASYMAFNEYQTYMHTHTQAAIETLLTGRLLPQVLPPNRLRAMLSVLPPAKGTLLQVEPLLLFQYARIYLEAMDFAGFRFAFIMELPVIRHGQIMPKFEVANLGFHQPLSKSLYKVPLPSHVTITPSGQAVALDVTHCEDFTLGLGLCRADAENFLATQTQVCIIKFLGKALVR